MNHYTAPPLWDVSQLLSIVAVIINGLASPFSTVLLQLLHYDDHYCCCHQHCNRYHYHYYYHGNGKSPMLQMVVPLKLFIHSGLKKLPRLTTGGYHHIIIYTVIIVVMIIIITFHNATWLAGTTSRSRRSSCLGKYPTSRARATCGGDHRRATAGGARLLLPRRNRRSRPKEQRE